MIKNSYKAKMVIILPQDLEFTYYYSSGKYLYKRNLKDIVNDIRTCILNKLLNIFDLEIMYENTITKIGKEDVRASHPVHENQIKLAERNGSLIIDTYTLLRYFEAFKSDKLNTEKFKEILKNEVGLLKFNLIHINK